MLIIQILNLLLAHTHQLLLGVPELALGVVSLHPEKQTKGNEQSTTRGSEVDAVADVVVGRVGGEEGPGGDETADVTQHDY